MRAVRGLAGGVGKWLGLWTGGNEFGGCGESIV